MKASLSFALVLSVSLLTFQRAEAQQLGNISPFINPINALQTSAGTALYVSLNASVICAAVVSAAGIGYELGLGEARYHGVSKGWLIAGSVSGVLSLGGFAAYMGGFRPAPLSGVGFGIPLLAAGLAAGTMTVIGAFHFESGAVVPTVTQLPDGALVPGLVYATNW